MTNTETDYRYDVLTAFGYPRVVALASLTIHDQFMGLLSNEDWNDVLDLVSDITASLDDAGWIGEPEPGRETTEEQKSRIAEIVKPLVASAQTDRIPAPVVAAQVCAILEVNGFFQEPTN